MLRNIIYVIFCVCSGYGQEDGYMYDELTEVDIKKMQEEIDHRVRVLRP